jgi:hypothetical protein
MTNIIAFLKKWIFYLLGLTVLLLLVFMKGCSYGKTRVKIPTFTTNTVTVHDTVIHEITDTFPYFIQGKTQIIYRTDTFYIKVDTPAVVKDYFSTHVTDNRFQDSLVIVDLKTYISENELKHSVFRYKILRDQSITYTNVDNSTDYARYVYLGASLPVYPAKVNGISNINFVSLNGLYAFKKGYVELNYQPYTKIFTLGTGIKLFQFKK